MKKEITELRIYHTMERLRGEFERMAKSASNYEQVKIVKDKEIYVPNFLRIIFKLDRKEQVAGYLPHRVFIDEMVDYEVADYARHHVVTNLSK